MPTVQLGTFLLYLFIKCNRYLEIIKYIQINENLQVTVFKGKQIIPNFGMNLTNNILNYWGESKNILTNVKNYELVDSNEMNIDYYSKSIECWKLFLEENADNELSDSITFILEQM